MAKKLIVSNIKGLRHPVEKKWDFKNHSLWQKLKWHEQFNDNSWQTKELSLWNKIKYLNLKII